LPGNPDIVLPRHRKVIFVHGCFWHGHENCRRSKKPSTNIAFWDKKISGNVERDKAVTAALNKLGWQSLTIWQCDMRDRGNINNLLRSYLIPGGK
jgi:DNA mismatch endonuclease (patch repair protein)